MTNAKYAVAFFALAISCAICAWLGIPELLALIFVGCVFFAILGGWEEMEAGILEVRDRRAREQKFESQFPSAPVVLDPAGVVVRKWQSVRVIGNHPINDSGEVTRVNEKGVIVRFSDSSLTTFPVRLHRDDRNWHVEELEVAL